MDIPTAPDNLPPVVPTTLGNQEEFFAEARRVGLNTYLDELLQNHRLDYDDPDVLELYKAITDTLQGLKKSLVAREKRFDGDIIGVGSYHDGTKLKPADEFDFMYGLRTQSMINNYSIHRFTKARDGGHFKGTDKVYMPGRLEIYEKCPDEWCDCTENYRTETRPFTGDTRLSSRAFINHFQTLVHDCLSTLELPGGLVHGGWATPLFSGTERNGPAVTLSFIWKAGTARELMVTVDLVVCFPAPPDIQDISLRQLPGSVCDEVVEDLVIITGYRDEDWTLATSIIETTILSGPLTWTEEERKLLKKKILLGKVITKLFLTLQESTPYQTVMDHYEQEVIKLTEASESNLDVTFGRIYEENFLKVTEQPRDEGLVVCMLKRQQQTVDMSAYHPTLSGHLHNRVVPYCTVVSCVFKMAAILQHFQNIRDHEEDDKSRHQGAMYQSNKDMLLATLLVLVSNENERRRSSLLSAEAKVWKINPYCTQVHRNDNMILGPLLSKWADRNATNFVYKLVNTPEGSIEEGS